MFPGVGKPADTLGAEHLPGAIEDFFAATPGLVTIAPGGLFNNQAEDSSDPATPYIVFRISSDAIEYISDTSQWGATRVKFECCAVGAEVANTMAQAIIDAFKPGISLSFMTGVTTPFVMEDRSQADRPMRGKGTVKTYKSCVNYLARTRLGRITS